MWRRIRCIAEACLKREGLAFIGLMVSLLGAGILTLMLFGNLVYLREVLATTEIFYLSCGMLLIISILFYSTHRLLGSKQAIELEFWRLKAKFNQGDDDVAA